MYISTIFLGLIIALICKCDSIDLEKTSIKEQNTQYKVKLGETVLIPCVIENRKNANIIWQYSKSPVPETLTIGYFYYRKDYRIRVIANTSSEKEQSWNLEIRKVRFEDEGYYVCRVMAELGSLKRVVHLKVEVDLQLEPVEQSVNLGDFFSLICNTSVFYSEIQKMKASHHHSTYPKITWFKDNENLNDYYHKEINTSLSNINYKIEIFNKPFLWSRLMINKTKNSNLGLYKCQFRNQTVSTIIGLKNILGLNRRLFEINGLQNNQNFLSANKIFIFISSSLLSLIYLILY